MSKLRVVVLCCTLGIVPAVAAQGTLVSRLLLADPVTSAPGTFSVDILVQARIVGDPDAINIIAADYWFTDQDSTPHPFSPAPLTIAETVPEIHFGGPDPRGRTGMFPKYRSIFGDNNDDLGNGRFDEARDRWTFLPLTLDLLDEELVDHEWSDIYKLRWTTENLTERPVRVDLHANWAGYRVVPDGFNVQPVLSEGASIGFFVPAPASVTLLVAGIGGVGARRRR